MPHVAAVTLDGPKGVGKTSTASRRAVDELRLDLEQHWRMARADPELVTRLPKPLLIDEWQRVPAVWDAVRRAVDDGADPGSFLLAGSASPSLEAPIHSGAGRILSLRIRPMALCERDLVEPSVSMAALLRGGAEVSGTSPMGVSDYLEEILASGFPGLRGLPPRVRTAQLRSYTTRIFERELPDERGVSIRRPASLMGWLSAYASAVGTTATWETIRTAATPGDADPPTKATVSRYRDWLTSPVAPGPRARVASPRNLAPQPGAGTQTSPGRSRARRRSPPRNPRNTGQGAGTVARVARIVGRGTLRESGDAHRSRRCPGVGGRRVPPAHQTRRAGGGPDC